MVGNILCEWNILWWEDKIFVKCFVFPQETFVFSGKTFAFSHKTFALSRKDICILSQNQFGQTLPVYFTACKFHMFTMERFIPFYFELGLK